MKLLTAEKDGKSHTTKKWRRSRENSKSKKQIEINFLIVNN